MDDEDDEDEGGEFQPAYTAPNPDDLLAGFAPTVSFKTIGDFVAGKIVKTEVLQRRSVKHPDRLLFWRDGQPQWNVIITLDVTKMQPAPEIGTDESMIGERRLFAKIPGGIRTAIQDAMKNAGVRSLEIGHYLRVEYTDNGDQKNAAMNPPKIYEAEYV
jgi:hypothetical protein